MTTTSEFTAPAGGLLDHLNATADADRALPGTRARVTLSDGREFEVRITNREYIGWDKTSRKHNWGPAAESPFLCASFLAFAAAKRENLYTGTFDQFQAEAEEVKNLPATEDDLTFPTI